MRYDATQRLETSATIASPLFEEIVIGRNDISNVTGAAVAVTSTLANSAVFCAIRKLGFNSRPKTMSLPYSFACLMDSIPSTDRGLYRGVHPRGGGGLASCQYSEELHPARRDSCDDGGYCAGGVGGGLESEAVRQSEALTRSVMYK